MHANKRQFSPAARLLGDSDWLTPIRIIGSFSFIHVILLPTNCQLKSINSLQLIRRTSLLCLTHPVIYNPRRDQCETF